MLGFFFRKGPDPTISPENPGKSIDISVAFSRSGESWTEKADVVQCLSAALKSGGFRHQTKKSWIQLDSGFILQPRFLSLKPLDQGGVHTGTTLEISHPDGVPPGVFEFQYATGNNTALSIQKGFSDWIKQDLPVFFNALQREPEGCTFIHMDLPATETSPQRSRRVILGPVSYYAARPDLVDGSNEEHPPFCTCCLFSHSASSMKPLVYDGGVYGIRLFAMRNAEGSASVDCRANGREWEEGKVELREYLATWPDRGFEFRKQYVIIQNEPS